MLIILYLEYMAYNNLITLLWGKHFIEKNDLSND